MNITKILAMGAVAALMTSCGVKDRHEKIMEYRAYGTDNLTEDQINDLIDIYIEGLEEETEFMEKKFLIKNKLRLDNYLSYDEDDSYAKSKPKAVKARKDEINKATQKAMREKLDLDDAHRDIDEYWSKAR